jgi:hypothetical protein
VEAAARTTAVAVASASAEMPTDTANYPDRDGVTPTGRTELGRLRQCSADRRRFLPTGVIMQPTGGSITSSTGPSKAREYQRRADIAEPLLS